VRYVNTKQWTTSNSNLIKLPEYHNISNQLVKSNHKIPHVTEFCHLEGCINSQVTLKFYMQKYHLLKNWNYPPSPPKQEVMNNFILLPHLVVIHTEGARIIQAVPIYICNSASILLSTSFPISVMLDKVCFYITVRNTMAIAGCLSGCRFLCDKAAIFSAVIKARP
jgi:hypothetical protein